MPIISKFSEQSNSFKYSKISCLFLLNVYSLLSHTKTDNFLMHDQSIHLIKAVIIMFDCCVGRFTHCFI